MQISERKGKWRKKLNNGLKTKCLKSESQNTLKKDEYLLVGTYDGRLYKISIEKQKCVHEFPQLDQDLKSFVKSHHEKKIYITTIPHEIIHPNVLYYNSALLELDMKSYKFLKYIPEKANKMVQTYDGRYIITTDFDSTGEDIKSYLKINCARTWKCLNTIELDSTTESLTCSLDSKYVFLVQKDRKLQIFELRRNCIIATLDLITPKFTSMAMFKDNQNAIVSFNDGILKKIHWKKNKRILN